MPPVNSIGTETATRETRRPDAIASLDELGNACETIRQALMVRAGELMGVLDPVYAPTIADAIRTLEDQTCRIAVVGQIKAGKSTFINALSGRPHLLPSDINPWTTVVTRLHFRNADAASEQASFTLFDAQEWQRIAEGGGKLRELTERFVPGFDPELLRTQVEAMRRRAEARLGPNFAAMLGQRHDYLGIDRTLLERYVAAGDDPRAADPGIRLADITKTADLYFAGPRRGFPLTLIDTPGTNDPLLVRDEITRLSLGSADVYVVVLTARQPLSAGDLALLRILKGLHKERLVVFVNRIDALRDIGPDSARILAHVARRLAEELPGADIPIIAGSAYWAHCATAASDAEVADALTPAMRAYGVERGAADPGPDPARFDPRVARAALRVASGVPDVLRAIDRLVNRGNNAHIIRQLAASFTELAKSSEAVETAELEQVRRAVDAEAAAAADRDRLAEQWQREHESLVAASTHLEQSLAVFTGSLERLTERCIADLRGMLRKSVTRFADAQANELVATASRRRIDEWVSDPMPLRAELQSEFMRIFRYWEATLTRTDEAIRAHLQSMVAGSVLSGIVEVGLSSAPPVPLYPDLSALARPIALDLSTPWWKAWWNGRPSPEARAEELRSLIDSELDPVIEELIATAGQFLQQRAAALVQQVTAASLDVVTTIDKRRLTLAEELKGGDDPRARLAGLEQRQVRLVARAAQWTSLRNHLAALVARCEAINRGNGLPVVAGSAVGGEVA